MIKNNYKLFIAYTILLLMGATHYSVSQDSGTFIDDRDGQEYKWVRVGNQIWMAENLKFDAPNRGPQNGCPGIGVFIGGDSGYAPGVNGYYYDWGVAMDFVEDYWPDVDHTNDFVPNGLIQKPMHRGISPKGWHIPTVEEADILIDFLGGSGEAAKKLASTDWFGTNESGFNGKPSGTVTVP